jgi:hypothetical protein
MTSKLVFKSDALLGRGRDRRYAEAHEELDSQIVKDSNPYVPFRTGALASSPIRAKRQVGEIRYATPYAKRLYYGDDLNFNRTFHPQAGPRWLERAKAIWLDAWTRLVAKILMRGSH